VWNEGVSSSFYSPSRVVPWGNSRGTSLIRRMEVGGILHEKDGSDQAQ
jgi:hypothetical protein